MHLESSPDAQNPTDLWPKVQKDTISSTNILLKSPTEALPSSMSPSLSTCIGVAKPRAVLMRITSHYSGNSYPKSSLVSETVWGPCSVLKNKC